MLPSIDEALDSPRFAPFKDSLCERVKTPEFLGYWINKGPLGEPRKPADCDIVLLHFHGGGYVAGHPLGSLYQPLRIAEIAAQEGLSVSTFSLDYSLAPEAVFPTQQNEAVAAYKYLVSPTQMAIDPAKIIVYGESAGGHLAITLLDRLYSESIPRPGGAMLAAPWVNMHNSGQSFVRNKHLDLLHKPSVDKWAKYHVTRGQTGDNDKQTLRQLFDLSASVTESRNYLPSVTWVTVGGHEMFIDDVDLFVDNAKKAGANVVYEVVGRMPHLWQHVDMFKRKDYYKVQPGEDVGDMMKGAQRNAINNPDYLNLGAALTARVEPPGKPEFYATAGLLAPTIRFHQGRFYIVCTNASISPKGYSVQNFYISTDDIWSGQWSKPVLFDFAGIDTSLFIDDDGRAYIQGSWSLGLGKQPSSTIKQIEIDLETGKALSEPKEIWPGFAREDAEGPHVYRKDGYYYLVIAEGGTFEHHMVTAARATNIWGPYEAYNMNPLTTADGTGRYIQNTGHTDLFQDASGAWWAVLLGVRNDDKRHPMGRETFLVPVSWPEGEWPVFEPAELQFEREPALQKVSSSEINFIENDGLVHIRYPSQDRYERLETEGSFKSFKIKTSGHKLSSRAGPISFVGKRQRSQTCRATTELQVDANNASKPVTASLAVFKDELRHAAIGFDHATSTIVYESVIGETHSLAKKQLSPSPYRLILGIDCTVDSFDFFYGLSGEDTHSLGSLDIPRPLHQEAESSAVGREQQQQSRLQSRQHSRQRQNGSSLEPSLEPVTRGPSPNRLANQDREHPQPADGDSPGTAPGLPLVPTIPAISSIPSISSTAGESDLPSVYSIPPMVAVEFGEKDTTSSQHHESRSASLAQTTALSPDGATPSNEAVTDKELLHLAMLFRDKIAPYLPFVSKEDLADLPGTIHQRKDFACCMAFVTSRFVPGCKELRAALAQRVLSISRLAYGPLSDDPHEQWALLQCIAVLYAYASSSNTDPDLGDILPAGELSHWFLKASIETMALRISLHRSADHMATLIAAATSNASTENSGSLATNIQFRRYMLWLWLFTISHYTALLTGTPPTIREDSTITSSPLVLATCKDMPSVSSVLAEVELCLLWGQAGLQQRDLREWWCLSSPSLSSPGGNRNEQNNQNHQQEQQQQQNEQDQQAGVTSKLALLQDIHSALALWSRRWGLAKDTEYTDSTRTGPSRALTSVDFHYRFTRFCISTYAIRLLRYPSAVPARGLNPLTTEAVSSLVESADAAMHFSSFLLELDPIAKENSRYIADFGFAMVTFACWFIIKVSELSVQPQHRQLPRLAMENHLLNVKRVAQLLSQLALDRKHSPSIYSSRILAAIAANELAPGLPPTSGAAGQINETGRQEQHSPSSPPSTYYVPPPAYSQHLQPPLQQRQTDYYGHDMNIYTPNTISEQDLLSFQTDADMFVCDSFLTFSF
ncbi:hypothetical protein SBRCBS47491_002978 [Sporothrix bragantina]|uniref:Alpha/beta hydrolase fold-3 domain-containing protein n=1 Tax=Sporothrix bragantina TaxID=671064 RepID=A0ABP0BBD4_9PEZI